MEIIDARVREAFDQGFIEDLRERLDNSAITE
jgi:hypothetical protein